MLLIGLPTPGRPSASRLLLRSPLHQGSAPCPLTTRGGTQATRPPMAPPPSPRRPTLLLSTSGLKLPSAPLPASASPQCSPAPPHPETCPRRTRCCEPCPRPRRARGRFANCRFFTSSTSCARREISSCSCKARPQRVLPLLSCVRILLKSTLQAVFFR